MEGFDFDGVVTAGHYPTKNDVIITGRCVEESAETYANMMHLGIFCAVYFQPCIMKDKTIESSGEWKAEMINRLKIQVFHEDDIRQIKIIKKRTNCKITQIKSISSSGH